MMSKKTVFAEFLKIESTAVPNQPKMGTCLPELRFGQRRAYTENRNSDLGSRAGAKTRGYQGDVRRGGLRVPAETPWPPAEIRWRRRILFGKECT